MWIVGGRHRASQCVSAVNLFFFLSSRARDWQLGQVFNLNTIYRFTLLYGDCWFSIVRSSSAIEAAGLSIQAVNPFCVTTQQQHHQATAPILMSPRDLFYDRHHSDFWCKQHNWSGNSTTVDKNLCCFSASHWNGFMINSMVVAVYLDDIKMNFTE